VTTGRRDSGASEGVRLRIATRGSVLALMQAREVADLIEERTGTQTEIVPISTHGDRRADEPLPPFGLKGLFVEELEKALSERWVDIAVHSAKDVPAELAAGLTLAAALPREDPSDALVTAVGPPAPSFADALAGLGSTPRLGTSSVRRVAQLASMIPDATFVPIRGNVDTRVAKLSGARMDALVLATAGLRRLGLDDRIFVPVPIDLCVPAPGQGTIVVQARTADDATIALLDRINDADSLLCLEAERAVVSRLRGGCQMPIGAHASIAAGVLTLRCVVAEPDGSRVLRANAQGPADAAVSLGHDAAERLLTAGAGDILDRLRTRRNPTN
jgi:hydroxymethylbilane synthase